MMRSSDLSRFPTLEFEKTLWNSGFSHIAGIDEAGRGAWAGPVCAAVVILPPDPSVARTLNRVRDSKQMTPLERQAWAPRIQEAALAWSVGYASAQEIDTLGIVRATKLAASRAINSLSLIPNYLLTDYLLFRDLDLPQTALVKGDQRSLSVAAASVLAKTTRDALMRELDGKHPGYCFARHKGYGTRIHREALRSLGPCAEHRKSFAIR
ncbi:MAG: ribonuclease HII [Chloroflexota bacterium]